MKDRIVKAGIEDVENKGVVKSGLDTSDHQQEYRDRTDGNHSSIQGTSFKLICMTAIVRKGHMEQK